MMIRKSANNSSSDFISPTKKFKSEVGSTAENGITKENCNTKENGSTKENGRNEENEQKKHGEEERPNKIEKIERVDMTKFEQETHRALDLEEIDERATMGTEIIGHVKRLPRAFISEVIVDEMAKMESENNTGDLNARTTEKKTAEVGLADGKRNSSDEMPDEVDAEGEDETDEATEEQTQQSIYRTRASPYVASVQSALKSKHVAESSGHHVTSPEEPVFHGVIGGIVEESTEDMQIYRQATIDTVNTEIHAVKMLQDLDINQASITVIEPETSEAVSAERDILKTMTIESEIREVEHVEPEPSEAKSVQPDIKECVEEADPDGPTDPSQKP